MRSCDKPRDPSSTRMTQIRCRDRGYVANSCSRQKAQSLDILRAWPRNLRTVATESLFASDRGVRMSTTSKSDGGMAPSVTKIAKQSTARASATPTWTNSSVHWQDWEICCASMQGSKPGASCKLWYLPAHQGRHRHRRRCHAHVPPSRGTLRVPTQRMLPSVHQRRG